MVLPCGISVTEARIKAAEEKGFDGLPDIEALWMRH